MTALNYVIHPFTCEAFNGRKLHLYKVTIYAVGVKTIRSTFTVRRYIDALRLVQQLQLHISTNDRIKAA